VANLVVLLACSGTGGPAGRPDHNAGPAHDCPTAAAAVGPAASLCSTYNVTFSKLFYASALTNVTVARTKGIFRA
jgi:hypothetical protein